MMRLRRTTGCVAALLVMGAMFAAQAQAMTVETQDGNEDAPISFSVSGTSAGDATVFAYVKQRQGATTCELTASSQEVSSGTPLLNQPASSGATFDFSGKFQPKKPGRFTVCAFLATDKASIPLDKANASFTVASGKAYTPKLNRPHNGFISYEKLPALTWFVGKGQARDTLRIYRGSRPRQGNLFTQLNFRSGTRPGISWRRIGSLTKAEVKRAVPYGKYSWEVTRRDMRVNTDRTTTPRRFQVGPTPLKRLVVKLRSRQRNSIKRPGISKVTVRSAPHARVRLKLRSGGRTISTRSYREGRYKVTRRFSFPWSCSRTGSFKLSVSGRDQYGNKRQSKVRWNVSASRCASMKQAAEARKKAKEQKSNVGGGSCTPGYSPCLPPASDYDCAGGSGDGPKYVSGPVYVTGSDPYGLDSDGDGVGCE